MKVWAKPLITASQCQHNRLNIQYPSNKSCQKSAKLVSAPIKQSGTQLCRWITEKKKKKKNHPKTCISGHHPHCTYHNSNSCAIHSLTKGLKNKTVLNKKYRNERLVFEPSSRTYKHWDKRTASSGMQQHAGAHSMHPHQHLVWTSKQLHTNALSCCLSSWNECWGTLLRGVRHRSSEFSQNLAAPGLASHEAWLSLSCSCSVKLISGWDIYKAVF